MASDTAIPVYMVDAYSDPVRIKIHGRASYTNCAPLSEFFHKLVNRGKQEFVIDFSECQGMDSTFLGMLAGTALEKGVKEGVNVRLINIQGRNLELIENLGLHRIMEVKAQSVDERGDYKAMKNEGMANTETILKAHENLAEVDPSNRDKFQDVLSFLKKQIAEEANTKE